MSTDERIFFGTDGIRGLANRHPMTSEMVLKLGRSLGYQLKTVDRRPRVLMEKILDFLGISSKRQWQAVVSVGADVLLVGPLPTRNCFSTTGMLCDAGVVISASHNFEDNGILLFARDGFKLPDSEGAARS